MIVYIALSLDLNLHNVCLGCGNAFSVFVYGGDDEATGRNWGKGERERERKGEETRRLNGRKEIKCDKLGPHLLLFDVRKLKSA